LLPRALPRNLIRRADRLKLLNRRKNSFGAGDGPLTAYLALAHTIARRSSCALALAVFDGRRRYDLRFTDLAPETLPDFASPSRVCRMSRERIAGFPVDRAGKSATDQGKLWFARLVPGDLAIPVRMEFDSEFGTFTADLAELRERGVDLRFTE